MTHTNAYFYFGFYFYFTQKKVKREDAYQW